MNENLNLCEILKGHEGETFYSPIYGEVKIVIVDDNTIEMWPLHKDAYLPLSSNGHHKDNPKEGELLLFPYEDQRDWDKWDKENNSKTPKTWSELVEARDIFTEFAEIGSNHGVDSSKTFSETPIEKSALALLKIHQLMEVGYGGNITKEEWENTEWKYCIVYYANKSRSAFNIERFYSNKHIIAFHTQE